MLTEKNKAARITKEIIAYFLDNDLNDFEMTFHIDQESFKLSISAETDREPENFTKLLTDLQVDRQIEIDEYFNALLGSHCQRHDYSFLGKSIDWARGEFKEGTLSLSIRRDHVR